MTFSRGKFYILFAPHTRFGVEPKRRFSDCETRVELSGEIQIRSHSRSSHFSRDDSPPIFYVSTTVVRGSSAISDRVNNDGDRRFSWDKQRFQQLNDDDYILLMRQGRNNRKMGSLIKTSWRYAKVSRSFHFSLASSTLHPLPGT